MKWNRIDKVLPRDNQNVLIVVVNKNKEIALLTANYNDPNESGIPMGMNPSIGSFELKMDPDKPICSCEAVVYWADIERGLPDDLHPFFKGIPWWSLYVGECKEMEAN